MRKMTLLEMVQNILSAMNSDEVSSIADTVESVQVAEIIKETFYEQFNNIFVPEFQSLFQLESLNNLSRPNYMKIPDNVSKIEWIKYRDVNDLFQFVRYENPEDFLTRQLAFKAGYNLAQITDPTGINYFIETNRNPTRYTMFDDKHIVFDSIDLVHEATLQSTNSLAYGLKTQEFEMEDDYVPPIDANLFPLLLSEAKSVAFINLKQVSSSKEEQRARRQRIRMQNDQFRSRAAQHEYWERGRNYSFRRW